METVGRTKAVFTVKQLRQVKSMDEFKKLLQQRSTDVHNKN